MVVETRVMMGVSISLVSKGPRFASSWRGGESQQHRPSRYHSLLLSRPLPAFPRPLLSSPTHLLYHYQSKGWTRPPMTAKDPKTQTVRGGGVTPLVVAGAPPPWTCRNPLIDILVTPPTPKEWPPTTPYYNTTTRVFMTLYLLYQPLSLTPYYY